MARRRRIRYPTEPTSGRADRGLASPDPRSRSSMPEIPRRRVAVVGATGVAGQQFLVALASHPWFEVTALAASPQSAGKTYRQAITDACGHLRWCCDESLPPQFAECRVVGSAG